MEKLARHTAVVIGLLALELDPQLQPQHLRVLLVHDLIERVLENVAAPHTHQILVCGAELRGLRRRCRQMLAERLEFVFVVS